MIDAEFTCKCGKQKRWITEGKEMVENMLANTVEKN